MKEKIKGKKYYTFFVWGIRLFLVLSMIMSVYKQDWYEVKITLLTIALTFYEVAIRKITRMQLPVGIQFFLTLFIFSAQYLGTLRDWYGKFFWWDTLLHTISGGLFFFIGGLVIKTVTKKEIPNVVIILFGICFSLSTGVLWEIIEFIADSFFGANMQRAIGEVGRGAIMDTMVDLIVATIGTFLSAILYTLSNKRRKKKII